MGGTIRISRSLWDDPAFINEPFTQREAWVWLIAEAAWKDRTRRVGRREVALKRGQLAHSVRFMAEAWGWSKSRVQRFLSMLENRDMLRLEGGTLGQTVTICKYDEYQAKPKDSGTAAGHSAGQQRDSSGTNQKKGEIRGKDKEEEANASSKKKRGTRLPENWVLPRDWGEWALNEGYPEPVVRLEAEKFRDYWIGVSGQKAVKRDWKATWRNWMRNPRIPKTINGGQHGQQSHKAERLRGVITAAAAGTSAKDWG